MNSDPNVKRILLYGDSLVYGKKPAINGRWAADVRFSGVLQKELGNSYEIIEEGLRARNLKGENSFFPERNGLEQFGPIVGSHLAVDLVVLALGSNDCNATGLVDENSIKEALDMYREKLKSWSEFLGVTVPKLFILIPPAINGEQFDDAMNVVFGEASPGKQVALERAMREYCEREEIPCLVSSEICEAAQNGDGIHLGEDGNNKLGRTLSESIKAIL